MDLARAAVAAPAPATATATALYTVPDLTLVMFLICETKDGKKRNPCALGTKWSGNT